MNIFILYIRSHHVQTLRIQYFIAVVLTEKGMLKESEQILRFFVQYCAYNWV